MVSDANSRILKLCFPCFPIGLLSERLRGLSANEGALAAVLVIDVSQLRVCNLPSVRPLFLKGPLKNPAFGGHTDIRLPRNQMSRSFTIFLVASLLLLWWHHVYEFRSCIYIYVISLVERERRVGELGFRVYTVPYKLGGVGVPMTFKALLIN